MYTFENFYIDCLVKLAAAFVCGLFLGIERKRRFHSVGIRTLILISISSMSMGMVSYLMADMGGVTGDPTRIAAGVVTGIGFIGGGAIMHQGMNIKGLTSASIIWAACAMGLACGIGAYFIAGVTLMISLFILVVLGVAEGRIFPAEKTKNLTLIYANGAINLEEIEKAIYKANFIKRDMDIIDSMENSEITLRFVVKIPKNYNVDTLGDTLKKAGNLKRFSITEN